MSNYKVSLNDPISPKIQKIIQEFEALKTQAQLVSELIASLYQNDELTVEINPLK